MGERKIITLEEARYLREQLKPAFAGYLTDGNISNRDVLSTIMDLIVRGEIGVDMDTQKTPVVLNKIYYKDFSDNLLPFEKTFIMTLFQSRKELKYHEIRQVVLSQKLHSIISQNINAIKYFEISKSRMLLRDGWGNEIKDLKLTENKEGHIVKRPVETVQDLEKYKRRVEKSFWGVLVAGFMFSFSFLGLGVYTNNWWPIIFIAIGAGILAIIDFSDYMKIKYADKVLIIEFKNNIVPYTKSKYEDLFKFIEAYPLKKQRIYNEFMPHAIAFGLDKSWAETFGIFDETVVVESISNINE